MQKIVKRSVSTLSLVLLGAVLGPLIVAAASAALDANQEDSPFQKQNEAARLVNAYRSRLPVGILFMSVPLPEDGKECGYEPEHVFPDATNQMLRSGRENRYADYTGYWVLDHWRNSVRDEEWISAISQKIDDDLSDFETGFLRRCIDATLFSTICMSRVASYGDRVERFDHTRPASPMRGFGIEDQIVCSYVDGVAARLGIKVPPSRG